MNKLDSELKRLMTWAGRATPAEREEAPLGFANRIVALRPAQARSLLIDLKQIAWTSACVSLAVILGGLVVLARQVHAPEPARGIPSALSFLASNLIR
jgi:hypothetical protein